MPEQKRSPAYIEFSEVDRYRNVSNEPISPFKKDFFIDSLMHNLSVTAEVRKNNKVIRRYDAQKMAPPNLNQEKGVWTPGRSRLSLQLPFLAKDEELIIRRNYSWMDLRWMPPIFLEDEVPTLHAEVLVDVPYGNAMHFQAAQGGKEMSLLPTSSSKESPRWAVNSSHQGLGSRFLFDYRSMHTEAVARLGDRSQIYFSFDPPLNEKRSAFDSWDSVAQYMYSKIDRFDLPSNQIRDFALENTKDLVTNREKIVQLLSFLTQSIDVQTSSDSFQEEPTQPASKTFAKRSGSAFDVAILGKALLSSLGIKADLIAVGYDSKNPKLMNCYSPALFSSVILVAEADNKQYYFEPRNKSERLDQIPPHIQGQNALILGQKGGAFLSMPYGLPSDSESQSQFNLSMDQNGLINGDYELSLSGLLFEDTGSSFSKEGRTLSVQELQKKLMAEDSKLSWQSAQINRDYKKAILTVSGKLKPILLQKIAQDDFILNPKILLGPLFSRIKISRSQNFSSLINIRSSLRLSDNYKIISLPKNFQFEKNGIILHINYSQENATVIAQGIFILALPVDNQTHEALDKSLRELETLSEENLKIVKDNMMVNEIKNVESPKL